MFSVRAKRLQVIIQNSLTIVIQENAFTLQVLWFLRGRYFLHATYNLKFTLYQKIRIKISLSQIDIYIVQFYFHVGKLSYGESSKTHSFEQAVTYLRQCYVFYYVLLVMTFTFDNQSINQYISFCDALNKETSRKKFPI